MSTVFAANAIRTLQTFGEQHGPRERRDAHRTFFARLQEARDEFLALMEETYGAAMSPAEFDWWFSRNPEGSLMSVARDDGDVIGVAAHSLYRMALDGGRRPATFSVHATTTLQSITTQLAVGSPARSSAAGRSTASSSSAT